MARNYKRLIIKTASIAIAIFAGLYVLDVITCHRIYFYGLQMNSFLFSTASHKRLNDSPDNKYAIHFVNTSFQETSYEVWVTTTFIPWASCILTTSNDSLEADQGPWKHSFDIVFSMDNHYAGLVYNGWFVDCYDFQKKRNDSLEIVLFGRVDSNHLEKWKLYHQKISEILGSGCKSVVWE
jgi:hypothetical protein